MKHLLYFAGHRMQVYRWRQGGFTGVAEFEPTPAGLKSFEKLLLNEVKRPLRLLIDIIEEDFRMDRIPYVYGRDKRAVRERAIKRHYRQYTHTHLETQGRETEGRRDEIALISALTNSELFAPWVNILETLKIPLEGFYTVPLVGEMLLKQIDNKNQRVLLISQQVGSSFRESFYQNGRLKLSRLAPSVEDPAKHYKVLKEETERTIKFLENQHYVERDEILDIYIIAHISEHADLNKIMADDHRARCHLVDKDKLAASIGIKTLTPGKYADWLYAHMVLNARRLRPHYGTHKDRRYFYHYLAKQAMQWGAAVSLSLALLLSGSAMVNAFVLSNEEPRLLFETQKYNDLYKNTIQQISDISIDVNDVREAVDIVNDIRNKYSRLPLGMISAFSRQLSKHNSVSINRLQWAATYDANHSLGETKKEEPRGYSSRYSRRSRQDGNKLYEKILVDATIIDFDNNPRVAIERVEKLLKQLQGSNIATRVEILKMPFDIDPGSRFTRDAKVGNRGISKDAKFTMLLIKESEA